MTQDEQLKRDLELAMLETDIVMAEMNGAIRPHVANMVLGIIGMSRDI